MSSKTKTAWIVAAAAALAVAGSFALTRLPTPDTQSQLAKPLAKPAQWSAAASGRVEPLHGEIRLSAPASGRIVEVAVAVNDTVRAGDLLLRIDDEEARARVTGAEAEAQVRRRERDAEANPGRLALDRRQAEDTFTTSERAVATARSEFDRILRLKRQRPPAATDEAAQAERNAIAQALEKLEADRAALRKAQGSPGIPLPTRVEAGLTSARAELTLHEAALERTRLRAPNDGTILQIIPRSGETAAASPEQILIVMGDLTRLRVRAEVEERDVARVRAGQQVTVRSDAFPGREFTGTIASIARTLAPAKLQQRGQRRPHDLDTLEVFVDLAQTDALLPGMRVDVLFKVDPEKPGAGTVTTGTATHTP